jgi:hypothetical protein
MRAALEAVMSTISADQLVYGIKAAIPKSAAHGLTSFDRLATSRSDLTQAVVSMPTYRQQMFSECQLN